jgi:hypothetical protein
VLQGASSEKVQVLIINHIVLDVSIVIDYLRKLPEIYRTANKKQKALILNEIAQRININQHGIEIIWNEQYQLLLNQEILQFADTPPTVRKYPAMLPLLDDFRTNFDMLENINLLRDMICNIS